MTSARVDLNDIERRNGEGGGAFVGGRWRTADELRESGRRASDALNEADDRRLADEDSDTAKALNTVRIARAAYEAALKQADSPELRATAERDRIKELRRDLDASERELARVKRERRI